ncbi:MAG: MBL fold metallo-hydrolase RNA specificity domain-containing protein [Spirochaetota bacterium]
MSVKISFMGAAKNVTGSRYVVEARGKRILIDCGLYQERELRKRNWDPFPVPPESLDALLLTHAHLDHSGFIPRLTSQGFRGNIYCTPATREICRIALLDSAHLQTEDAFHKKKRHQKEGRKGPYPEVPLYTPEDARESFNQFSSVPLGKTIQLGEGIQATWSEAGHILGSAMINLEVETNNHIRSIIFSGDVGRPNKPILRDPATFTHTDYVIMESTYGDRLHGSREHIDEELTAVINSTRSRGGNILIPSFAIERAQEMMYHLNTLLTQDRIPHTMVFIDSPMAVQVTDVFKHHRELFDREMTRLVRHGNSPFNFPSLKMVSSTEDSKAINHIKGTVIIIAGSGMCTGGRIKHHLVHNIERPESTVLFVGYQAAGTLGRQILEGADSVRIMGHMHPVKARISQISGFSAHADRDELYRWISSLQSPPRKLFVTHGEEEAAGHFADFLSTKTGWDISVPEYGQEVVLD